MSLNFAEAALFLPNMVTDRAYRLLGSEDNAGVIALVSLMAAPFLCLAILANVLLVWPVLIVGGSAAGVAVLAWRAMCWIARRATRWMR